MKPSQLDLYLEELDFCDKEGGKVNNLISSTANSDKPKVSSFRIHSILQAVVFLALKYIQLSCCIFDNILSWQLCEFLHPLLSGLHRHKFQAALIITFIVIYTFQLKNIVHYMSGIVLVLTFLMVFSPHYLSFLSTRGENLCRLLLRSTAKIQSITLGKGFPLDISLVNYNTTVPHFESQNVFKMSCRDAKKQLFYALSQALDPVYHHYPDESGKSSVSVKQLETLSRQLYHELVPNQQQALHSLLPKQQDELHPTSFDKLHQIFRQFYFDLRLCGRLLDVELTVLQLLPSLTLSLNPTTNNSITEIDLNQFSVITNDKSGDDYPEFFDHYIHLKQSVREARLQAEQTFIRLTLVEEFLQSSNTLECILEQNKSEKQQMLAQHINQLLSLEVDKDKLMLSMQLAQNELNNLTSFISNSPKIIVDTSRSDIQQHEKQNPYADDQTIDANENNRQDCGLQLESGIEYTEDISRSLSHLQPKVDDNMTDVFTATVVTESMTSSHRTNKEDLNIQLQRKIAGMMVDELKSSLQERTKTASTKQRIRDFDRNETSVEVISPEIEVAQSKTYLPLVVEKGPVENSEVKGAAAGVVWSELQAKLSMKASNEHCLGESDSDKDDDR